VPATWKIGFLILIACLLASMVIAIVRLSSTPEEIMGLGFHGLPQSYIESHQSEYAGFEPAER
jgi:hypothetical protein